MTTAFYSHDDCMKHDMGPDHPESPERLSHILARLADTPLAQELQWIRPDEITREQLLTVHPESYLRQLEELQPAHGRVFTDEETAMTPTTLRAARLAAGACVQAVDRVMAGQSRNAFACVRPPGHHAERTRSMGFCFYNNPALAAQRALAHDDIERVAIIDFDVHQGNGTVDIVGGDERILMCSSFQHPFFPHSHVYRQAGNIINVPIEAGCGSEDYRKQVMDAWQEPLRAFKPQLLVVSAGFDGHRLDPMGELNLETDDFRWLSQWLVDLAEEFADGRLVSMLEGGYHMGALCDSVIAHLEVLTTARAG
ncbi:MAG: histone deacetylase family protein [Alteromonadaceae bacterium]|nr:histone deacetylase family protein [Alteromonadaceae bacterium]